MYTVNILDTCNLTVYVTQLEQYGYSDSRTVGTDFIEQSTTDIYLACRRNRNCL